MIRPQNYWPQNSSRTLQDMPKNVAKTSNQRIQQFNYYFNYKLFK